jgi:TPR repeat protein
VALGKLCAECGGLLYGRWKRCGGCKVVFYCNAEHAAANWVAHRDMCRAEQARIEAIACESGLVLGADAEAARRAAFLAAEAENAAAAAMTAERARIEALDEESLRAELSFRGIIPPRGTPLAQLLAQRLAAPEPTPETLQASRLRARTALAMSACHLCGKAFEGEDAHTTRGRCGGCRRLRYCGVACQKSDWPAHKPQCKAWRAEDDAEVVAAGGCPLGDVKAQRAVIQKWAEPGKTLAEIRAAAEGGDLAAQCVLGECIRDGKRGATKDMGLAVSWYHRAASSNMAVAQLVFGQFHEQGVGGLTIDPAEGARLYALAAAHGLSDAQWRLGFCYEYGEGVLKDVMEARRLYQLAAEKGDANAEAILGHSYMTGSCGPRDFSLAMHWSRRAAEKGSGLAENSIGRMFFEGLGVPRDLHTAASWFSRAAAHGDEPDKTSFRLLSVGGAPEAAAALQRMGIDARR